MTSAYFKSLDIGDQARYKEKLTIEGKEGPDPYDNRNKDKFVNDCTLWPTVQWPHLYDYLVKSPGPYTGESLKAFKSLEAFNYFQSGKIYKVLIHKPESSILYRIVLATVAPGQRNGNPYECWIVCHENGEVFSAHCQCIAGIGEVCSHIAAVLFAIEAAVTDGATSTSVTCNPCTWKTTGKKVVQSMRVIDINFCKPTRGRTYKKFSPLPVPVARGSPKKLLSMLMEANPNAKILRHFPTKTFDPQETDSASEDEIDESVLPMSLINLYNLQFKDLDDEGLENVLISVFDSLCISQKEADYLELASRKQNMSEVWRLNRKGRICASQFHRAMTFKESTSSTNLVRDIMGYTGGFQKSDAMVWGIENEGKAREKFIQEEQGKHQEFSCRKAGLVVNTKWPHLGASPDGFTECICCGKGIVEIKCPFTYKMSTIEEALEDPKFYLEKNKKLKPNHQYYTQVQGQLFLTRAKFCFFVVFIHDEVTYSKIYPDTKFWEEALKPKLDSFYIKYVLPEILTRRLDTDYIPDGGERLYFFMFNKFSCSNKGNKNSKVDRLFVPHVFVHEKSALTVLHPFLIVEIYLL
ncbi:uncharacterized protein RB166_019203 [Leptodactylus fuscus]|uniref:uncharacterized protein LOC142183169 n=1 Tax=Leptodactylus fuscus TaxID=238119 RepID=UPI003F4F0B21